MTNIDNVLQLAIRINRKETTIVPILQRNHGYYALATYINHSIALLISESYDNVALFVDRANREISQINDLLVNPNKDAQSSKRLAEMKLYFDLCFEYLTELKEYLTEGDLLTVQGSRVLPREIERVAGCC